MKKTIAVLSAALMLLALTACGKEPSNTPEDTTPVYEDNTPEETTPVYKDNTPEETTPVYEDNTPEETESTEEETDAPEETETVEGDPMEYSREFWEAKYPGQNLCPFYIEIDGKEYSYYLLMTQTSTMKEWLNTEFNWNGWHLVGEDIVDKDEKHKLTAEWIGDEPTEAFSSFCTVKTEPYTPPEA